jgi:hypothetical protein
MVYMPGEFRTYTNNVTVLFVHTSVPVKPAVYVARQLARNRSGCKLNGDSA